MSNAVQAVFDMSLPDGIHASTHSKLSPLIKWAGGKDKELRHILPLVPRFERYFEPFVGGGAVFFALRGRRNYINDKSDELINLYDMVKSQNSDFFKMLDMTVHNWTLISALVDANADDLIAMYEAYSAEDCTPEHLRDRILEFVLHHTQQFNGMFETSFNIDIENFLREIIRNLVGKTSRMRSIERKKGTLSRSDVQANMECALKSAFYMHFRHLYNRSRAYKLSPASVAAIFFFVRENAYASMFRYNRRGEFNVPYGGIAYNRKDLARKVQQMRSPAVRQHLSNTVITSMDFEMFLDAHQPTPEDFVFLDPPYDSDFSTYALNEFNMSDQERLANYLLHRCQAKFMLVIKNTPAILNLYGNAGLNIRMFDKKYLVSFQNRNNKQAEHLLITNY